MTDEVNLCESCGTMKHTRTATVQGIYYRHICGRCLGESDDGVSGNAASYERRRGYEDRAQDTIQPYDANGKPRVEFLRLYPEAALKVFGKARVDELKRKI